MSFILDALRKSDTERQQQSAPGLTTTVPRGRSGRRSIWIPLLTGVLVLNAAVLAWIFIARGNGPAERPAGSAPPAVDARSGSAMRSNAARPAPSVIETDPATRSLRGEATASPASTVAKTRSPTAAPARMPAEIGPAESGAAPAPAESAQEPLRAPVPSYEQLLAGGMISVAPLHLDIHVFSAEPSQRFVFINMNKYREGERLNEGPVVEEITSDGVTLSHQGSRFTLDRN